MTDEPTRETLARIQARFDALQKAPPLDKARTFLREYCVACAGLSEIDEQVRFSLGFNALPVWTGLEGLEAVLGDSSIPPDTLVALVRQDANQTAVAATPEAARAFLTSLAEILRRALPQADDGEGAIYFGIDEVYTLPDAAGHPARLRCIDMFPVEADDFAVFVPEHADETVGPFTVYRLNALPGAHMTYERETRPALLAEVLRIARSRA